MRKIKTPKLPLQDQDRKKLRKARIRISQIPSITPELLAEVLEIPINRAQVLVGLGIFQKIPSVGLGLAKNVVDLGYYSLDELKNVTGAQLVEDLERLYGFRVDPCVEDSLRLVVHYAQHPNSDKRWWDFTEERKAYRKQYGYPADRPARSWDD